MVQLQNYTGREAYIAISLINPNGEYEKTLAILGADEEWYNTLEEWDKFRLKKSEKLNAITFASVAPGARSTRMFEFENDKIDKGYKLRFETSVETLNYYLKDVEVDLSTAVLDSKTAIPGTGFVKIVRFNKMP